MSDINDKDIKDIVVEDTSSGTAEDVEAIMKKYDRESNVRKWEGTPKIVIRWCLATFSMFAVYMNLFANWDERVRRSLFLGLVILLVFALYPIKKGEVKKANYIPFYDIIIALIGGACYFYYVVNFANIIQRASRISNFEIGIGIVGILILIESCRRVVGIPILVVASVFMAYAFIAGKSLKVIIYNLYFTTSGVIGTPIGVCSTYIVLFILFGAFLEATGISNFFIKLANSIAGASTGGPAKVAVISSALCGMVSGSSVANTVTTGCITIPLMKETGYKAEFAGAVEAAASTGGQIMPPIMGAAAFLMAEMAGVPYASIAVRAILPAFLYFAGIFLMVHLEAKKLGLKGLKKEDLPKFVPLFIRQGYLLIPLLALVVLVMQGTTMSKAAVIATIIAILVSMVNKENRMTPSGFITALENGGKNTLSVAVACGVAGIIAGVVTMTGLGQLLITTIVSIAGNNLMIALVLTMFACILLGMGVPTTANYIIMATTCAPILINGMGVNPIAAHMFVFYFGIVADITPPVALAAYAGAAIAKANPMKTGINATRLAIAAFIVPYIFVMSPGMLFIDTTIPEVILIIITSCTGMFGVSAGLEGYMITHLSWPLRIISAAGGLMLIIPGWRTDLIGISMIALIVIIQVIAKKKNTPIKV